MQTVTIHISRRKAAPGYQIEWYVWNEDSITGIRPKRKTAAAGLIADKPAQLRTLKEALQTAVDIADLRKLGRKLAAAIGSEHIEALDPACRIYICAEDPSLNGVPWELIETSDPLVLQKNRPLIRSRIKNLLAATAIEPRPLKVLLLVGLGDKDEIGGRDEVAKLKRLFWQVDHTFDCITVDAKRVPLSSANDLVKLLKEQMPDIFHFIGHGSASSLEIFDSGPARQIWEWKDSAIRLALQNSGVKLRLAYLNACRTQQGAGGPLNHTSIASAFLDGGALATVSMQADVPGVLAAKAAFAFYQSLAEGEALETAMQRAREASDNNTSTPYLPVLTVAAAAETILPKRPELDVKRRGAIDDERHLGAVRAFVDRHSDRRTLIRNFLRNDAKESERYSAARIEGRSRCGKTWFCLWWLRMCVCQRMQAYYAVPPQPEKLTDLDWLEYVRCICEGNETRGPFSPGLPPEVRTRFQWEIEQIFEGKEAPFSTAPAGFHDPRRTMQQILEGGRAGNDFAKKALACFHDALRRAAGSEKLVLICDEWLGNLGLGASDVSILKSHLFDPIAEEPSGPVRLIVTLPDAADPRIGAEQRNNPFRDVYFSYSWHKVTIDDFNFLDIRELLSEYIERCYPAQPTDFVEGWNPQQRQLSPEALVEMAENLAIGMGFVGSTQRAHL